MKDDIKKLREKRGNAYLDIAAKFAKDFKVRMSQSLFSKIFGSSVYSAHQGEREKSRRLRQMKRGMHQDCRIIR